MRSKTQYLNTDFDLVARESLEKFAAAFESEGLFPLHVDKRGDKRWYATFETKKQFKNPESNIGALLTATEKLIPYFGKLWTARTSREFNIGYDCGDDPWAFSNELTAATLARTAALGISLRITLYPAEPADQRLRNPRMTKTKSRRK